MTYIARRNELDQEQMLKDHLIGVAKLSKMFATEFESSELAYQIGLLHDVGKYSDAFQRRIRGSNEKVDHSTAGSQLSTKLYNIAVSNMIAFCVAGHHGGLPNVGNNKGEISSLTGRLSKNIENYDAYKNEISFEKDIDLSKIKSILKNNVFPDYSISFYIRMLFSCLVDADFLDTEHFMNCNISRKIEYDFREIKNKLILYMRKYKNAKGIINEKRQEILNSCIEYSEHKKGVYRLTVPTGGGKTLSSFTFAVNHLIKHNLNRIIYVIPYTSIIDQTAKIFKEIVGDNLVLEHHYNYEFEFDENNVLSDQQLRLKHASQNWDYPIIVTTNVQFFESLYSNKTSRCRKLHNLANSIIIFDEVQMFPYYFLKPCLLGIEELVLNYGTSVVLSSATQPSFDKFFKKVKITDIIDDSNELNSVFRRVTVNNLGIIEKDNLVKFIRKHKQVLVIVNSRKSAFGLFDLLENNNAFCLTTLLTPNDRKKHIDEIKKRLDIGEECTVISTQLIEAGVDVDFPFVYREIAGIDSIVQASGRCNREGKSKNGVVNIFTASEDKSRKIGHLSQGIEIGKIIMKTYDEVISPEAISNYFDYIYDITNLDNEKIIDKFVTINSEACEMQYEYADAAQKFKMIDNYQKAIIIPNHVNQLDIDKLKYADYPGQLLNKLQKDTVMVYSYEFERMYNDKKILDVSEGIFVLADYDLYKYKIGLNVFYGNDDDRIYIA